MEQLSVLTLNVFFGLEGRHWRTVALLALCREVPQPCVLCLQEVTPYVESAIRGDDDLQEMYVISPWAMQNYGIMMLVTRGLCVTATSGSELTTENEKRIFNQYDMPTEMERTLLTATINWKSVAGVSASAVPPAVDVEVEDGGEGDVRSLSLCIATAHFESLSSPQIRRAQLTLAEEVLRPYEAAILCGDFNFDATRNWNEGVGVLENHVLGEVLPAYTDVWSALRPGEDGYTFDSVVNGLISHKRKGGKMERMRYDRCMCRGIGITSGSGTPTNVSTIEGNNTGEIHLIGTQRLPDKEQVKHRKGVWGNWREVQDRLPCTSAAASASTPMIFTTPPRPHSHHGGATSIAESEEREGDRWLSDHFGLLFVLPRQPP